MGVADVIEGRGVGRDPRVGHDRLGWTVPPSPLTWTCVAPDRDPLPATSQPYVDWNLVPSALWSATPASKKLQLPACVRIHIYTSSSAIKKRRSSACSITLLLASARRVRPSSPSTIELPGHEERQKQLAWVWCICHTKIRPVSGKAATHDALHLWRWTQGNKNASSGDGGVRPPPGGPI